MNNSINLVSSADNSCMLQEITYYLRSSQTIRSCIYYKALPWGVKPSI